MSEYQQTAVVIVKHKITCGVCALADRQVDAYKAVFMPVILHERVWWHRRAE